jgi:hypothetical protein
VSLGRTESRRVQAKLNREKVRLYSERVRPSESRSGWTVSWRCCKVSRRGWKVRKRDGEVSSKAVKQFENI